MWSSLRIFQRDKAERLRSITANRRDIVQINRLDIKDDRQLGRRGNGGEANLILSDHELEREVGEWSGRSGNVRRVLRYKTPKMQIIKIIL